MTVFAASAIVAGLPAAGHGQPATDAPRAALLRRIDALLATPTLRGGIQGVLIRSLADGTTWYERNSDLLFMPASNQKLIVSAAALCILGPDWRPVSRLVRTGPIGPDRTLEGDLVLQGAGDPTLESADMTRLADAVRRAGIRRVRGRVLGDDSRFDAVRYGRGWSWDYLSDDYAAEIGALTIDRGVVRVRVEPGRAPGELVQVALDPPDGSCTVVVEAATGPPGSAPGLTVERSLGSDVIRVTGSLPLGGPAQTVPTTIDRPARYVATVLAARLKQAGVAVDGGADETRTAPPGAVEIARLTGKPLSSLLVQLNKTSDNLIAECLLKTLGAEKGRAGSAEEGARVIGEWLASVGVDPAEVRIADGSGLSRLNGVSPRALVGILAAMHARPDAKAFFGSLPVAGVDGTLRNRLRGSRAANNCRAKTGYIGWVSSLSGIVTTRTGEPLAFSILMNNHRCPNAVATNIQDRIVDLLAETAERKP
jgi:D-alanyl-D-alanine carboxypeptidase/D-alanyl-D-alanine-endopeptidase (penicillin-binding protein 4)